MTCICFGKPLEAYNKHNLLCIPLSPGGINHVVELTMIDASARLRRAILLKDALLVKRIVQSNPAALQNPSFDDKGNTSLHLAAETGSEEIVQLLLDAGHENGDISRNANWDTPLMVAARNGKVEVGILLISRFPRCIPWTNKAGLDAVCRTFYTHFKSLADFVYLVAGHGLPQRSLCPLSPATAVPPRVPRSSRRP